MSLARIARVVGIVMIFVIAGSLSAAALVSLLVPGVQSFTQALSLSILLAGIAVIPASLCWWFARPLHRGNVAS